MTTKKRLLAFFAACFAATINAPHLQSADGEQAASADGTRPNFIVIFCDNLGYGDIEPFGSKLNRTPCLNRMAREGRKLTHFCVTAGVCTPSRSSLVTGCYAQRVGMHDNPRDGHVLRPLSPYGLAPAETTIAEVLKQQGYATAIIGKWHLGDQPEFLPTRQGFDSFFGVPYSDDMTADTGKRIASRNPKLQGSRWPPLPLMQDEQVVEAPVDRNTLTKRYTQKAIDFISENKEQPFFLYLPHAMPGSTREPFASPDFRGRSEGEAWGDSVEELDWSTGEILDHLVDLELDERTLVIWTSDNGAPMAAREDQPHRGTNAPLHGRGYSTSEGAFRVPTIAWWPRHIPAATSSNTFTTTMDLVPTFARLAGSDTIPEVDGFDLEEILVGQENQTSKYDAFFYYDRDQLQAVRSGPWKLFLPLVNFTKHPHFKSGESNYPLLFNVEEDVACKNNRANEKPEIVKELMAWAEKARTDLGDRGIQGTGQRKPGLLQGKPTPRILEKN